MVDIPPKFTSGMQAIEFVLPKRRQAERSLAILGDQSVSLQERLKSAASLLDSLETGTAMAANWAERYPKKSVKLSDNETTKDIIIRFGGSVHRALEGQGILWPPPYDEPPPAITRDLLDIYIAAVSSRRSRKRLDDRLRKALNRIQEQSRRMQKAIQDADANSAMFALDYAAGRVPHSGSLRRPLRNRISVLLSGVSISIGLLQGPGAINEFVGDSIELAHNIGDISDVVTSGVVALLRIWPRTCLTGRASARSDGPEPSGGQWLRVGRRRNRDPKRR